jgi:hypothetical protein
MDNASTAEIKRYFDDTVASLRADLKADIRDVRLVTDELREEIRDVKRHPDVVAESLRSEIRLVAEGVAGLDEKLTQEFVTVRAEMREQIGDVKALLRGGYADFDRRVTKLEEGPA